MKFEPVGGRLAGSLDLTSCEKRKFSECKAWNAPTKSKGKVSDWRPMALPRASPGQNSEAAYLASSLEVTDGNPSAVAPVR